MILGIPHPFERGQRTPCPDCGETLLYKKGQIRKAYWSHLSKSNCKGGESLTHKLAKFHLCEAINRGEEISFKYSCPLGEHKHLIKQKLEIGEVAKTEVKLGDGGFADIAILDKDGNVKFIVEICNTHRTEKRDGEWAEVKADEVFPYLEAPKDSHLICIRKRTPSQDAPCWKMLQKKFTCQGRKFAFNDTTAKQQQISWQCFCLIGRCIDCFRPHPVKKYRPFCTICYKLRFPRKRITDVKDEETHRLPLAISKPVLPVRKYTEKEHYEAIQDMSCCAISDFLDEVQRLVNEFNISAQDIARDGTFHCAAKHWSWNTFKWLVIRFRSVFTFEDYEDALFWACEQSNLEMCKWISDIFPCYRSPLILEQAIILKDVMTCSWVVARFGFTAQQCSHAYQKILKTHPKGKYSNVWRWMTIRFPQLADQKNLEPVNQTTQKRSVDLIQQVQPSPPKYRRLVDWLIKK